MNTLSLSRRVAVVSALVEGNSVRATCRMTGVAKNTVLKLLAELGTACALYADEKIRGVASKFIQVDEIWAFVYAKAKNVPEYAKGMFGMGDVWTWTAIDADSKLVVSWLVGKRDGAHALHFMSDVAKRVTGRPQINSDGFNAYTWAVGAAFEGEVDHAVITKVYGAILQESGRYSPPSCKACTKEAARGNPDMGHASTSYVERQNLTMRMSMRRFTRLTNGFSKKVANLEHAVSLHFMHYNFCRPHQSLDGMTPAEVAGLADHRWTVAELVSLIDTHGQKKAA